MVNLPINEQDLRFQDLIRNFIRDYQTNTLSTIDIFKSRYKSSLCVLRNEGFSIKEVLDLWEKRKWIQIEGPCTGNYSGVYIYKFKILEKFPILSIAELNRFGFIERPFENETFTEDQMLYFIECHFVSQFIYVIEDLGLSELLWDKTNSKPLHERYIQLLFYGFFKSVARNMNISLNREPETGSGKVDFIFNSGSTTIHFEIKKIESSKFYQGLEFALPAYMKSDKTKIAYYIIFCFDELPSIEIKEKINFLILKNVEKHGIKIIVKYIDARLKVPGSRKNI